MGRPGSRPPDALHGLNATSAPFVFVTGKGGTGKTTVAAALAHAAAAAGARAVICDVAGGTQLAERYGASTAGARAMRLAAGIWLMAITPDDALAEWMRRQPGGAIAATVLRRSTTLSELIGAAPGARELLTLGNAADLVRVQHGSPRFDRAIVDGPSTGHALAMLASPSTLGDVAAAGPIGEQARALHAYLADPACAALVGVTLPEEMAMHELLELDDGLCGLLGRPLDLVVVNGVEPDRFSNEDARRMRAAAARMPAQAPLLHAVLRLHHRARAHATRVAALRARLAAPVVTLPSVAGADIGPEHHARFGRLLATAELPRRECGQAPCDARTSADAMTLARA